MRRLSVFLMAALLVAGTGRAQEAEPQVFGDLAEVMRGILFPNSNIIFDVQTINPNDPVEASAGDSASARFSTMYTGWEAVENAAVALVEAANLIELPRVCENVEDDPARNGLPAPVERDDWRQYVAALRAAGQTAYEWALAREYDDFEAIIMTGEVSEACSACHGVYRDSYNDPPTPRCTPPTE